MRNAMISRWGIGTRLFLAFLVIAALGLTSGLAGWLTLRDVAETQETVTSRALPAVTRVQSVARISAEMVAAVPELTSAATDEERAQRAQQMFRRAQTLDTLLAELQAEPLDDAAVDELSAKADTLVGNLKRQDELVARRLRLTSELDEASMAAIAASTGIADVAADLVANSSTRATAVIANLYGLIDSADDRERAWRALDRLVETDLYLLERMFELRLRSSQIALLVNQLDRTATASETDRLQAQVRTHLRILERRVDSIDDPVRRGQARAHYMELSVADEDNAARNVFELRRQVIAANEAIQALSLENRELAALLDEAAMALVSEAQAFSERAAREADRATLYGLWTLLGVSAASLLIAALIVWLYVQRNIVRRLNRLSGAMRGLAGGDLTVDVRPRGTDELADMARAVKVFKDDAIRRRRLEAERDQVERELRAHREELQRLVDERTAQLSQANTRLRHEVAEHARARTEAERASRAKSEFLATVSHEIRTPMSGVLGMLRVLRDSDQPPVQQREWLERVESSAQTLLSILNGILDYSKAEAGRVELEEESFEVCELLDSLVATMRTRAEEKGLVLRSTCDSSIPHWLYGDAAKIRQILFNLVGNALNFTDSGEVVVEVTPVDSERDDGAIVLRFSVADTGIGMPTEEVAHIFEPFRQIHDPRHRGRGGTGLGLAIAQRMVEAMNGAITAESAPGTGSTFAFTVPLRPGAPSSHAPDAPGLDVEAREPRRILVVEDNDVHRIVVTTMLERMGHTVSVTESGERALEAVDEGAPPDVVLLDINLPGMDGLETAARLRSRPGMERVPVVAMSAHVFRSEIESYRAAGMDAVIIKPVWPETLQAGLREAFNGTPGAVIGDTAANPAEDLAEREKVIDEAALHNDLKALGTATLERIIRLFLETVDERVARIGASVADGDVKRSGLAAHELKSAAQCVGLCELGARCAELEEHARAGNSAHVEEVYEALKRAHPRARAALESYRSRLSPETGGIEGREPLH